ncbi:PDZ domain-containing protein 11 isoform 1-T1 [Syngnathus typhle]
MDQKIPYDDYQLPVVFLPSYENPPAWIPPQERIRHPDYNNELTQFLPRTVVLKKPPGAQLGFNIRGGKASQLGIFISKVVPDSDAHRAGLQEGDQVLSVNEVDFQDIEHSRELNRRNGPNPNNVHFYDLMSRQCHQLMLRMKGCGYSKDCTGNPDEGPLFSLQLPEAEGEDCPLGGVRDKEKRSLSLR